METILDSFLELKVNFLCEKLIICAKILIFFGSLGGTVLEIW